MPQAPHSPPGPAWGHRAALSGSAKRDSPVHAASSALWPQGHQGAPGTAKEHQNCQGVPAAHPSLSLRLLFSVIKAPGRERGRNFRVFLGRLCRAAAAPKQWIKCLLQQLKPPPHVLSAWTQGPRCWRSEAAWWEIHLVWCMQISNHKGVWTHMQMQRQHEQP